VLVAGDGLTENSLLVTVRLALGLLRNAHGTSGLYANEDWHDHDGFIRPERAVSWTEAQSWTQDLERLRRSCSDDWRVYTLLYPDDFAFCLRYWPDADGECSFDLCAERGTLEKLATSLQTASVPLSIEPSARNYFDRRWGG
jgi:hypothetical protein